MLETLKQGFTKALLSFQGKAQITEAVIDEACGLIRNSLLEADVEYTVIQNFLCGKGAIHENSKKSTVVF